MVDGRRARTTKAKTRRRSPATGGTFTDGREPGADLPGRNGYSADAVIARSIVATRLKAHGAIPSLPLTVLSSVTKIGLSVGWVPADVGTVALFKGPDGAPWVTFRSDGEMITAPLSLVAFKEARRAAPSVID